MQNAFFCPGKKRTACSRAGAQDSKMQIGVFSDSMAKPTGMKSRPFIWLKNRGSTLAIPHMAAVFIR